MTEVTPKNTELLEQHTGFEKHDALPVPIEYLPDADTEIVVGPSIEVPQSVLAEGLRIRRLIEATVVSIGDRFADNGQVMGPTRIAQVERLTAPLLADFYQATQEIKGDPIVFVAGEKLMPVPDEPQIAPEGEQ